MYADLALYLFSTAFTMIATKVMHDTQGWHNLALILLLAFIFVYSVSKFLYLLAEYGEYYFLNAVALAAQNFCHWIITATYIKVSF